MEGPDVHVARWMLILCHKIFGIKSLIKVKLPKSEIIRTPSMIFFRWSCHLTQTVCLNLKLQAWLDKKSACQRLSNSNLRYLSNSWQILALTCLYKITTPKPVRFRWHWILVQTQLSLDPLQENLYISRQVANCSCKATITVKISSNEHDNTHLISVRHQVMESALGFENYNPAWICTPLEN